MFYWKRSSQCDTQVCLEVGTFWRKSTHSLANGDCAEVQRPDITTILVRDSTNRDGPTLKFTTDDWKSFLSFVK